MNCFAKSNDFKDFLKDYDAVIINDGYNMHYLSGYSGHEGCLLCVNNSFDGSFAYSGYLLTDSRYTEVACKEAPDFLCVDIAGVSYENAIKKLCILHSLKTYVEYSNVVSGAIDESAGIRILHIKDLTNFGEDRKLGEGDDFGEDRKLGEGDNFGEDRKLGENDDFGEDYKVGFENEIISYKQFKKLNEVMGKNVVLAELDEKVNSFRQIKCEEELGNIKEAEAIGDKAFGYIVDHLRISKHIITSNNMTEMDVAMKLENFMKKHGASALSFDTICASGINSSMPHAVPTTKALSDGDFLTMDFGCIFNGYCSDMTRTVYIGENPDKEKIDVYNTVLLAQTEALKAIKPGAKCSDVDKIARDIIANAGYGKYFGHGLGHSVGLYIHEEPRLSPKCDVILKPGMTMTVEPGIYLPGKFGVRIEDLVVVTEDGYKNLTNSPKELICI